jgi:hypothetical protein
LLVSNTTFASLAESFPAATAASAERGRARATEISGESLACLLRRFAPAQQAERADRSGEG